MTHAPRLILQRPKFLFPKHAYAPDLHPSLLRPKMYHPWLRRLNKGNRKQLQPSLLPNSGAGPCGHKHKQEHGHKRSKDDMEVDSVNFRRTYAVEANADNA